MTDDALPLVERDPTPPFGTETIGGRTVRRSMSGILTLTVVLTASLTALVAVLAALT